MHATSKSKAPKLKRERDGKRGRGNGKLDTQAITLLSPTDAVNGAFWHANPATP
jgi:hypothetical protein